MAGNSSLARLTARIEELDDRGRSQCAVVGCPASWIDTDLEQQTIEEHYRRFPQDRSAHHLVVVKRFANPPDPDVPATDAADLAWKSVAREQRAKAGLAFWEVPGDALPQ
jgi:hypothetical protein